MKLIKILALFCCILANNLHSISKKEKAQINKWLELNKTYVNQYSDPVHSVYRTNIFIDQKTNKPITLHEYISAQHPDKPWSKIAVTTPPSSQKSKKFMNTWLKKNHRNIYGDDENTVYKPGQNPLIINGQRVTPEERVKLLYPHKPWKAKK